MISDAGLTSYQGSASSTGVDVGSDIGDRDRYVFVQSDGTGVDERPTRRSVGRDKAVDGNATFPFVITRRRCEDCLLFGGVVFGTARLASGWAEYALAGEISLLLVLSVAYRVFRWPDRSPPPQSPMSALAPEGRPLRHAQKAVAPRDHSVNAKSCIWGTDAEREYRDCSDDGVLFAILLGPLVSSSLLHAALSRLAAQPNTALVSGWNVERPLVLPSTPMRHVAGQVATEALQALSALATARRNLVQLCTLLSFVLLVQLARSWRHDTVQGRAVPKVVPLVMALERDPSDSSRGSTGGGAGVGTFWLRRGEWKRNLSVVGFACIVTACCIGVKIVTAYIGRGIWSDMSASDIIIATLFYQFSLYVCVRLAKRGFTLGELGVVCHAATALFMETINMTRMKIGILRTPYIKTYRLPTPLLTFQLALMPGSLLTGFLLSPLLYLSRHLAQKPAYRLRFPHEKPMHRRLLALGFYAGALLVCGGVVGLWARWCLGSRDPWLWVVLFLLDGKYTYTRPALIAYWSALAAISVAGWQRQLSRARRHRTYVVAASPTPAVSSALSDHFKLHASNQPSTVTQMMDAADHAMPVLSVNARRKFFHALAVIMFIPGIAIDPAFTHLSLSVAFAAFTFAEYVRYFALWPLGASVHLFLNEFLDHKDSGTAILSHFYLLAGCAAPLWLEGPSEILAHFGVLALGIGDALASIVGRRFGHVRWASGSGKTIEGSAAFFLSVLFSATALAVTGATERFSVSKFAATTAVSTVLEAVSMQNDNLILPMYGWAIGTLLGV